MTKVILCSLILLSLSTATARRDHRREARQGARMAHGVKSGELTKSEVKELRKGKKEINQAQRDARKDGVISADEKARLESLQDTQSKNIHDQKHDEEKSGD